MLNLPRNTCISKLGGTKTFRASAAAWLSSNTFNGYGTNLQNQPDELRRIYYADEGKFLVQRDQSGAEALIVAWLCHKGRFRELFLNNVKPHVFVAMHVFLDKWKIICKDIDLMAFIATPIPDLQKQEGWKVLNGIIKESDKWASHERYYAIAKMICHAANYGMYGSAFQLNVLEKSRGQIVLTKKQADDYLLNYHSLFPEINDWHRWVIEYINKHAVLYNLFGYPRVVTGKFNENDAKEWFAFCPQSTVGCITHIEITHEQQYINITTHNSVKPIPTLPSSVTYCLDTYGSKIADWDILANTHDSSLTQCPEYDVERCNKVKAYLFNQELTSPRGEKFSMKSEGLAGKNWGKWKESVNENGLKEIHD